MTAPDPDPLSDLDEYAGKTITDLRHRAEHAEALLANLASMFTEKGFVTRQEFDLITDRIPAIREPW